MHLNRQTLNQECSQTCWQFPGHCFASCHAFPWAGGGASLWVVSPGGVRIPSRAGGYCPRGGGVVTFFNRMTLAAGNTDGKNASAQLSQ